MAYLPFVTALALLVVVQWTFVSTCKPYRPPYGNIDATYNDYYLGTMSLADAQKGKRKRDVIFPWSLVHSLILFRGKVFEWGIRQSYYMRRSRSSSQITWAKGRKGRSRCLRSDVENWTRNYRSVYGSYDLFSNNCHFFVNRLVKYLDTNCGR